MTVPRPAHRVRVGAAATATLGVAALGWLLVVLGRGRYLEDLCLTREPEGAWLPPELTVVRGPRPDGLLGFRCESAADPRYGFGFVDPLPFLATCAVLLACAGLLVPVWRWARSARDGG